MKNIFVIKIVVLTIISVLTFVLAIHNFNLASKIKTENPKMVLENNTVKIKQLEENIGDLNIPEIKENLIELQKTASDIDNMISGLNTSSIQIYTNVLDQNNVFEQRLNEIRYDKSELENKTDDYIDSLDKLRIKRQQILNDIQNKKQEAENKMLNINSTLREDLIKTLSGRPIIVPEIYESTTNKILGKYIPPELYNAIRTLDDSDESKSIFLNFFYGGFEDVNYIFYLYSASPSVMEIGGLILPFISLFIEAGLDVTKKYVGSMKFEKITLNPISNIDNFNNVPVSQFNVTFFPENISNDIRKKLTYSLRLMYEDKKYKILNIKM